MSEEKRLQFSWKLSVRPTVIRKIRILVHVVNLHVNMNLFPSDMPHFTCGYIGQQKQVFPYTY